MTSPDQPDTPAQSVGRLHCDNGQVTHCRCRYDARKLRDEINELRREADGEHSAATRELIAASLDFNDHDRACPEYMAALDRFRRACRRYRAIGETNGAR